MTTDTHDTAAALEAAIDALIAVKFHHVQDWADAQYVEAARAAVRAAITAHVEAEVSRRLAAAPEVEAAIVAYAHAVQSDFGASEERDTLRTAIAAAQARAVEAARVGWVEAVSEERATELVDEFARRFAARSRSAARGSKVWERESVARAALLAALTGGRR